MNKVLIVCSGGMSSAIVVKALLKSAEDQGKDIEAKAVGSGELDYTLSNEEWDIVLVAPQVKHLFDTFKASADAHNVPIVDIAPREYGPLGGAGLIKKIEDNVKG